MRLISISRVPSSLSRHDLRIAMLQVDHIGSDWEIIKDILMIGFDELRRFP